MENKLIIHCTDLEYAVWAETPVIIVLVAGKEKRQGKAPAFLS
jgi:hypothetical protein